MPSERTQVMAAPALSSTARRILKRLERLEHGELEVDLGTAGRHTIRGAQSGPTAHIHLRNAGATLRQAMLRSDMGFAEAYLDGAWDSDDLATLLYLGALNENALAPPRPWQAASLLLDRVRHRLRRNSRQGSRRNIHAHYDLGNRFYEAWLDPGMTYSSALFATEDEPLETAHARKYQRLLDQLGCRPGDHILEIGCGWGGFAEYAARQGMRVTGITLSREQLAYAGERIRRAELDDRVNLAFCDYRDLQGRFDHIVSIEMFEAVGESYWPAFFATLQRCLKPGGRAAIQTIIIDEDYFAAYRRSTDFIQRYVFPGGMLPSPEAFHDRAAAQGMSVSQPAFFGRDYATTLKRWAQHFESALPEIRAQGFDERFIRLWRYYLAYCQAGFRQGRVNLMQVCVER